MEQDGRSPQRSPARAGIAIVLAAAAIVLLIGPRHDRVPAIVVIAVALVLLAVRRGR